MKTIKNITCCLLAILAILIFLVGIFMLTNGSLETYPTEEQLEKVRIAGVFFVIVGAAFEAVSIAFLCKINKKKTN